MKETGFASFTPNGAKAFIKEQQMKQPQDAYAGRQRHKQKQNTRNKYC